MTGDDFRGVQLTPHNSEASIIFGKGITSAKPGSADSLVLVVNAIDAARDELITRGVDVSEVREEFPRRRGERGTGRDQCGRVDDQRDLGPGGHAATHLERTGE